MYKILKFILYFACLFIRDSKKRGSVRRYARSCEAIHRIKRTAKSVGKNFDINGIGRVNENTVIGDNVGLQGGLRIDGSGNVIFGNNIAAGPDLLIIAQNHDYDNGECLPFDAHKCIYKDIIIEDNVWIGSRVTLIPGAILREGCIIQAGSVVVGEIPKCAIAGGHPAKVFKYRDMEHYEKLKAKQLS